jgi:hypothetical protein
MLLYRLCPIFQAAVATRVLRVVAVTRLRHSVIGAALREHGDEDDEQREVAGHGMRMFYNAGGIMKRGERSKAAERPTACTGRPARPVVIWKRSRLRDAAKTASGLSYKRLVEKSDGLQVRPDESVLIRYTGWRQSSGETFFTTGTDGQTITVNPGHAAPAFREVIPLLHKGEQIMVWVPAGGGMPEPVVYEVELVDVVAKAAPTYSAWR